MADPRFNLRQIAAPNFSAANQLMIASGKTFADSFDPFQDALQRYGQGQKERGDAQAAALIAGVKNEEDFNKLLSSGDLQRLNTSAAGTKMIENARAGALGLMGDRQNMRIADDENARSWDANTRSWNLDARQEAAEGRRAEEFGWGRDERAFLAGPGQQAYIEATRAADGGIYGGQSTGGAFSTAIDRTESGGGADQYDTLYGHRNRNNGVRVSQMTIGEAGAFASPSGQYGQSVNSEIGRVATPMGKFQIVGTTLRGLQKELNLPDDVPFSPAVQEQFGLYLGQKRVLGPRSQQGKRDGLRAEWEGFKHKSNAELDAIIADIESQPVVTRDTVLAAAQGGSGQGGGNPGPGRNSDGLIEYGNVGGPRGPAAPEVSAPELAMYEAALAAGVPMNVVMGYAEQIRGRASEGQERVDEFQAALDAEEALARQEERLGVALDAVDSPVLTPDEAYNRTVEESRALGLPNTEALARGEAARQAAIADPVGMAGRAQTPDELAEAASRRAAEEQTFNNANRELSRSPAAQYSQTTSTYSDSENIAEDFLDRVDFQKGIVQDDGRFTPPWRSGLVEREPNQTDARSLISQTSRSLGISQPEAAALLELAHDNNPNSFWNMYNSLGDQFDPTVLEDLLGDLKPGQSTLQAGRSVVESQKTRMDALNQQIDQLEARVRRGASGAVERQLQEALRSRNALLAEISS